MAEAPEYKLTFAFWHKAYSWVTADEIAAIKTAIDAYYKGLFGVETELVETYKLSLDFYEAENSKVGELSAETKALHDGKGVGLIIGSGGNATDAANMGDAIAEQKDCPTSIIANNRKVSLCEDSFLYRALFDNYFVEAAPAA